MEHTLQLGEILKDGMYPVESEGGDNWRILHGDTLKLVKAFQPGTFDAVITDPPYASGGTKQNERNRTTNQKYSSMSPEKALPDFDGDQKIDLRRSTADSIGSVASFLSLHGWQTGAPIALHALVQNDPAALIATGIKPALPLRALLQQGIVVPDADERQSERPAALIDLVSPEQPTEYWVGFDNFYVITRYNRSSFYAMSVFQLAEALRQAARQTPDL